jgi:two-component sensor histidine kinase
VGRERVCFKSRHGLDAAQVDRGPGPAAFALDAWIRRGYRHSFHYSVPLRTGDGHELGQLCVLDRRVRRIDGQKLRHLDSLAAIVMDQLELRLSAQDALARAEVMIHEVEHRAMNSLQVVASLLQLQSRSVQSPATAAQLTTALNRVLAVARIHRAFSSRDAAPHEPIVAYLRQLCGDLSQSLATDIKVEGIEARIPKAQILAIGLVANEFVTNARKHGAGAVTVTWTSHPEGQHELRVLDEGEGLPEGFALDRARGDSLGMKLVSVLAKQLDGRISAMPNPAGRGSCFTLAFPAIA